MVNKEIFNIKLQPKQLVGGTRRTQSCLSLNVDLSNNDIRYFFFNFQMCHTPPIPMHGLLNYKAKEAFCHMTISVPFGSSAIPKKKRSSYDRVRTRSECSFRIPNSFLIKVSSYSDTVWRQNLRPVYRKLLWPCSWVGRDFFYCIKTKLHHLSFKGRWNVYCKAIKIKI